MATTNTSPPYRAADLDAILRDIVPLYLSAPPSKETLRAWFDSAKIPRLKTNPAAIKGGGKVFYQTAAVEKYFSNRFLTGRLTPLEEVAA